MNESIDVIVPSFRLDDEILIGIFSLKIPDDWLINFYLIADNPGSVISPKLSDFIVKNNINLIINDINLGFSKTRNKGIDAGKGAWILLLDDDIIPNADLLISYSNAISQNPDCLGFAGATNFPKPFNAVTEALQLNGSVGHFSSTIKNQQIAWTPTANVLLNSAKLCNRRFLPELKNGGEDIELLVRNSNENAEKYLTVPEAGVAHPWWDEGKSQLKRMFRYGMGIGDIIDFPHHRPYTFFDFTTTSESIALLILFSIITQLLGASTWIFLQAFFVLLLSEFITNIIRCKKLSGRYSLRVTLQMLLHKNAYELGVFLTILKHQKFTCLFKRLDVSFYKPYPSPFRLNRWKIIKLSLIAVMWCIIIIY